MHQIVQNAQFILLNILRNLLEYLLKLGIIHDNRYYAKYFQTIDKITQNDLKSVCKIRLIQLCWLASCFHLLILIVYQNKLSLLWNLILDNVFYIENIHQYQNAWFILFYLFDIYLVEVFYFRRKPGIFQELEQIIVYGRNDFFLNPLLNSKNAFIAKFNMKTQSDYFRFIAVLLANFYQIVNIFVITFSLYNEIRIHRIFIQYGLFNDYSGILKYSIFRIVATLATFSVFNAIKIFLLAGSTGVLFLLTGFRQMKQMYSFISDFNPIHFTEWQLRKFFKSNVQFIRLLEKGNGIYGKALFIYSLLSYPN